MKTRLSESQAEVSTIVAGFFRFCFRLQQPSFHWIMSDGVVSKRNGNVVNLPNRFCPVYDSAFFSDLRFSLVISALTIPTPTPSPTPSPVKTSLIFWVRIRERLTKPPPLGAFCSITFVTYEWSKISDHITMQDLKYLLFKFSKCM